MYSLSLDRAHPPTDEELTDYRSQLRGGYPYPKPSGELGLGIFVKEERSSSSCGVPLYRGTIVWPSGAKAYYEYWDPLW